jgi:hypothetical protein
VGNIKKILSKATFDNNEVPYIEIELNDGEIIHLQNKTFRIEMNTLEYKQFAQQVVQAMQVLKRNKGLT